MTGCEKQDRIKIFILLGAPLSEQNYERVGIPHLTPYFEVTVLDCTPWLGRINNLIFPSSYRDINYKKIDSETDFSNEVWRCSPGFAIDFVGYGSHTKAIQKILSSRGVKFVVQKTGTMPAASLLTKIYRLIAGAHETEIRHHAGASVVKSEAAALNRINMLWTKMKNTISFRCDMVAPDVALLAGSKSLDRWTKMARQIIWIGSQDYYLFKSEHGKKKEINQDSEIKQFVLFIDDCLPYASDWELLNIEPPVIAASYYLMLLNFFEKIEATFDLPVVIAAHPNGLKVNNYDNNFGGRQVISGQTNALVLESSFVLTHASTAISFAILARKPIIFVASAELRDSFYGASIENLAKSIGQKVVVVDELSYQGAQIRIPEVNEGLYRRYERNYLKNEYSNEDVPWEGFIKYALATKDLSN
jgi:hypothetical protein